MNNIKLLPSLLVFAEVARRGSFTEAAHHLNLSKSAASQHIRRLEEQIGLQLLSRNTRGMALTAAGAKLLSRSELLQDQVELAFQELSSVEQTPSGLFSVTFPTLLEKDIAIPALRQLCVEYPRIDLRVLVTDDPLDIISEKLDVAIYGGELEDSNYRALPIGTLTEIFCASPAYIQKFGAPKTPDELAQHRWIATRWQKTPLSVYPKEEISTGQMKGELQTLELKPFTRCNVLSSAIEMTKQGMGIALLPETTGRSFIRRGLMAQVISNYGGQKCPFYFIHPFRGEKPIHVTRFYKLIKHYFSKAKMKNLGQS